MPESPLFSLKNIVRTPFTILNYRINEALVPRVMYILSVEISTCTYLAATKILPGQFFFLNLKLVNMVKIWDIAVKAVEVFASRRR